MSKVKGVLPYVFLGVVCVLCAFLFDFTKFTESAALCAGFGVMALLGVVGYLLFSKKLNTNTIFWILFIAGFILRLCYIAYTPYNVRQHDVYNFNLDGSGGGHARYILWFFWENKLADFDPRSIWQFYHPPLHHFIAGMFMRFLDLFKLSFERICESVQILTLFYSSACMIIFAKILKELNVKKTAFILSFSLIAFNPSFVIFAGSINNDILSITFMLGAILWTIRWYKQRYFRNILPLALCIGLGMMTKLSVALVAPAVAVVFLICFVKHFKAEYKNQILQFFGFGLICVPLGLWYSVRNYLKFKIPFGYVPLISSEADQYIGFRNVFERLFDFKLNDVFMAWGENRGGFFEHNIFLGLFKTSVFGEFRLNEMSKVSDAISIFSSLLFFVNLLIALISFGIMIYVLIKKKVKLEFKAFSLVLFFTIIYSYISFCFKYPHTCTMNIRYAVPLVALGVIFIGVFLSKIKTVIETKIGAILAALIPVFSLTSCIVYTLLGI